jgi:galactokinase
MSTFHDAFGIPPESTGWAPGRVNLIGDHTDYNGGFVLPAALSQRTTVELARGDDKSEAFSTALGRRIIFDAISGALPDFARYIGGCLRVLATRGIVLPPLKFAVSSDVPVGMGLSSSAALEVATLRAVDQAFGLRLSGLEIAQLAWEAETKHAGVNCGIMDQMACAIADYGRMLFLDTRSRDFRQVPVPDGADVVIIDSGVSRSLAASGYNGRRAECDAAAQALGVDSLRDITDLRAAERLPAPLRARVRHVLSENERVLAALDADSYEFGRLMNESHASLRDDYEVSHPVVDALVNDLQCSQLVYGARMTGAGFGGGVVALAKPNAASQLTSIRVHCNARVVSVISSELEAT